MTRRRKRASSRNRKPPRRATKLPEKGAETPSSKPGVSPVAWDWEKIGKVLPGIIRAVAVLIDAILKPK
jgi:hypothetical protein